MSGGANRETFASRIGFIFLSAGCAIGLGNVWRFPFVTGKNGGAIFVLIYLFFLVLFTAPIMIMELAVGRASRLSVGRQFAALEPKGTKWHCYGIIGLIGNYILMSFYTVVSGWMLYYFYCYAAGTMEPLATPDQIGGFFGGLLGDPTTLIVNMLIVVAIGSLICGIGLRNGVERITKVMMSGLLVLMIVLAVRSVSLPGASAGLAFYLSPDIEKFKEVGAMTVIYEALGQAFFTLSTGIGSMAIFGSYIGREKSLTGEGAIIALLDTFVAFFAGLIIFPSCFAYGVDPGAGPGLLFVSLPNMFVQMPGGRIWGTFFFLFMSFAALSTVVAVFEHIIANSMDMLGWSRLRASVVNFFAISLVSVPCALGFNLWSGVTPFGEGSMILDIEDFVLSNNLLPIGSLVYLLFCTTRYGWGWDAFKKEADSGDGVKFPTAMRAFVTYVVPAVILFVFVMGYWDKFFK